MNTEKQVTTFNFVTRISKTVYPEDWTDEQWIQIMKNPISLVLGEEGCWELESTEEE